MACFFHTTKVGVSDYGPKAKLLDALTQAIEDSRAVHLLYQSEQATEPASRDVYPYTFAYHHGSIYLIAHDPNAGKIKQYKLDRVEDVEVSPFPFRRPPDFDVRQHLLPSFGVYLTDGPLRTIKVRFAPAVAPTSRNRNGTTGRPSPSSATAACWPRFSVCRTRNRSEAQDNPKKRTVHELLGNRWN